MNRRDRLIAEELKRRIEAVVGERLVRFIVYGSRARGDATVESDLDVVAVVWNRSSDLERVLGDVAYEVMWQYDFSPIISLKVLDSERFEEYRRKGYSFYRNVSTEGVAL